MHPSQRTPARPYNPARELAIADWQTVEAEEAGWSSPKLAAACELASQIGSAALMVVVDGHVTKP